LTSGNEKKVKIVNNTLFQLLVQRTEKLYTHAHSLNHFTITNAKLEIAPNAHHSSGEIQEFAKIEDHACTWL